MNCLKKFKIKHYDNLQTTKPKKEEKNATQSLFTETPNKYKKEMKLSIPKLQAKTSIQKKYQRMHASKFKTQKTKQNLKGLQKSPPRQPLKQFLKPSMNLNQRNLIWSYLTVQRYSLLYLMKWSLSKHMPNTENN